MLFFKKEVLPGHKDCQILVVWLLWADMVSVQINFRDLTCSYPLSGKKTMRQTVLKSKIDFIQCLPIMIQCTQSSTQLPVIYNKCCHQCTGKASKHELKWSGLSEIYPSQSPAFPSTTWVTVSVEMQLLFWVFSSPKFNLYKIVYSPDTLPFQLSATAVITCSENKAIPAMPIKGAKQQGRSPFKILQYSSIHWLSFKTLRINSTVSTCT